MLPTSVKSTLYNIVNFSENLWYSANKLAMHCKQNHVPVHAQWGLSYTELLSEDEKRDCCY